MSATFGLFLAFGSALISALWHAVLKAGADRPAIRAWNSLICATAALPVIVWKGALPAVLWPTVTAFAMFSAINAVILARSYDLNDFSAAYPVARGVVPLAMAGLGVVFLGDRLSGLAMLGIVIISLGILALALGRGMSRHGWFAAILTGLTTIGYNVMAARGIRGNIEPLHFLAWLYLSDAVLIPFWLIVMARKDTIPRLRSSFMASWPSGVMTLISFSALVLAMRYAPLGMVSAIRETSVLIGLALAAYMLKERLDTWRIGAGLCIFAGALILVFG